MNYSNLAQTGAAAVPAAGLVTHGSWVAIAATASIVGVMALAKLVMPSAKARP